MTASMLMKPSKFKRINVEISNVCNLKCSFCPEVDRARQVMSPEDFERVIADVAPLTEEVVLHLLGEPLNHPQLDLVIAACERHQVPVNVVTNGVLLNAAKRELLLQKIVRQVSFSLQSFEDNFKGQDPRPYLKKIQTFVDRALVERPDLYVNLRFWDLGGTSALATERNGTMRALLAETFGFDWCDVKVDLRRRKNWKLRGRLYLHFDSRFSWPSLDAPLHAKEGYCHGLTGHVGIHADGTVVPCCLDQKADMALGNVFDASLAEILDGPRARNIREGFAAGELREALCQRCTFITRFGSPRRASSDRRPKDGSSRSRDLPARPSKTPSP